MYQGLHSSFTNKPYFSHKQILAGITFGRLHTEWVKIIVRRDLFWQFSNASIVTRKTNCSTHSSNNDMPWHLLIGANRPDLGGTVPSLRSDPAVPIY